MKLLELLAKELKEWPESDFEQGSIESMSQADDMRVSHYSGVRQVWREDVNDWSCHGYVPCSRFTLPELATDHATAIVTRADWEAEKARIAGKVDGGWKRHRGGKQPVADGVRVDYRMRNGRHGINERSELLDWGRSDESPKSDIMAFRIHKPAEQPAPVSEEVIQVGIDAADAGKLTSIGEVKARWKGKRPLPKPCADPVPAVLVNPPDGPLEWRDRIYELDTQRAELEATYQRQIGEIDGERDGLVGKLKAEGFSLIEQINAGLADAKQAHDGMDDWRNWKAGDLVECRTARWPGVYASGDKYAVIEVNPLRIADDCGGEDGSCLISEENAEHFKWRSRPGK